MFLAIIALFHKNILGLGNIVNYKVCHEIIAIGKRVKNIPNIDDLNIKFLINDTSLSKKI
jgi:hypothetical protein